MYCRLRKVEGCLGAFKCELIAGPAYEQQDLCWRDELAAVTPLSFLLPMGSSFPPSPSTCLGRPGSRAGSGQVQAVMLLPLCAPWNFYDLSPLFILSLSLFLPHSQVRERANPRSLQRQARRRAAPAATSPMWMALQVVVPPVWPRISDPAQHLVARSWRD